jgi:putative ABC transport system permease protein
MNELAEHNFGGIGRLKPGVTEAQAQSDLSVITRRPHDQHLDNPFVSRAAASKPLLEDMVGDLKQPLYVLLAATGCVLLIACLNVANLLVARATARRKDLAIRSALGGGRWRLLRERLTESLLLSAGGGAGGLVLAYGAVEWVVRVRPGMSRVNSIHVDSVVVAFTIGIILFCAFFAGIVSAFSTQRVQLVASLQDSARGTSAGQSRARIRMTLLGAEVGLTVILLVAAGLLLKSYQRLRSSDLGCITDNVLTMRLDLFGRRYNKPEQLDNFYRMFLERVRAIPGVDAAGFTRAVPGQGYWGDRSFTIVEHPPLALGKMQFAINRESDPGFFTTMGIPFLRGRTFDASGQRNEAVINSAFARHYFPSEDPIGKHLTNDGKNWEIVGVVGDTRYAQAEEPKPIQYLSLYGSNLNNGSLVIRSRHNVEQFAIPVQRILAQLDPQLPVSNVLTMQQLLGKSMLDQSFNTTLLVGFAALSLLLAAVGLFGVLSYVVAQRTGEIGIRMALGAPRAQVLRRILVDGLRPAVIGLALGLIAAIEASRLVRDMLYQTPNLDPLVFATVAGTLLIVAAIACLLPAWRASRIDPMQALRTE